MGSQRENLAGLKGIGYWGLGPWQEKLDPIAIADGYPLQHGALWRFTMLQM